MILTGAVARVLHLHPSRRCNLRCLHCYSVSGPTELSSLPGSVLASTVADAAAEEYNVVSLSGGEPLMYRGLVEVLDASRAHGMATLVVTNGMLLDERRISELQGRVSLLAISLDGRPALHNRIRQSERAFDMMLSRLEHLRAAKIPFGFVLTLSTESFDDLIWAADFAVEQGARLLHIHPLGDAGRALSEFRDRSLNARDRSVALLAALSLAQAYEGKLQVHIDLVGVRALANAFSEFAIAGPNDLETVSLASLVSPLVIEEDGTVVPLEYGMDRRHALGSITQDGFRAMARRWRASVTGYVAFRERCKRTREALSGDGVPRVVDWYEEVMRGR